MLRKLAIEDAVPVFEPLVLNAAARRAALIGCVGEAREQLLLMLELLSWRVDDVSAAGEMAAAGYRLLFIDAEQVDNTDLAINSAELVVFLGQPPAHGRALISGKSIIWLPLPLDIVQLEHVIVSAG